MRAAPPASDDLDLDSPPDGFKLELDGREAFVIRHKRTGMGCMNLFLMVWLAGWTVGCVFLLQQYFAGGTMDSGDPIPWWFVALFWAAEIGVAALLLNLVFSRKRFRVTPNAIEMETDLLGWKRTKTVQRSNLRYLEQVKDGGEGEDSFPSWGLVAHGAEKTTLIYRQPHNKSLWLGRILARWTGAEFRELPEE